MEKYSIGMKCAKCHQTISSLTKDGKIPVHRIRRGYKNQGAGMGGTDDLDKCPYSGSYGEIFTEYVIETGYHFNIVRLKK